MKSIELKTFDVVNAIINSLPTDIKRIINKRMKNKLELGKIYSIRFKTAQNFENYLVDEIGIQGIKLKRLSTNISFWVTEQQLNEAIIKNPTDNKQLLNG